MKRDGLLQLLEPCLELMGYELVDLDFSKFAGGGALRIFIDAPTPVTVDDCARASRRVSEVLDAEDPIAGRYVLEVSSPGADRVLRKRAHFERFLGARVHVELKRPLEGRRRFTGTLLSLSASGLTLAADGAEFALEFDWIQKTKLKDS